MKTNHFSALIFSALFLFGCSQPIGKSLLSNSSLSGGGTDSGTGSDSGSGNLEIRADNQDLSVSIEDNDRVEINGPCSDLDVRQNRILVEAFSGEDENSNPYVSNAISDYCQSITMNPPYTTGNGLSRNIECFWVTKGVGIIEDAAVPFGRKSFPQCHNGRFGFSVRLGAALTNPAPASGSRYLIRFKLRTTSGSIKESQWARVYVTRKLTQPVIDTVVGDSSLYTCTVQASPARFNQNILYTLTRDAVGSGIDNGSTAVSGTVMYALQSSLSITTGNSVYNWVSDSITPAKAVVLSGVSYYYKLTALENTAYADGFVYAPALSTSSTTKTCTIQNPAIIASAAPTNVVAGNGASCYLSFSSARPVNPGIGAGSVRVQWAYTINDPGWTGPASNYNGPVNGAGARPVFSSACSGPLFTNVTSCTSVQAVGNTGPILFTDPLIGDGARTYYWAAREYDVATGSFGKWSNEVACKPPVPQ